MKNLPDKKSGKSKKPTGWISGMGGDQKYMGLGIQAGISVAFYVGMGLLLDKWLGTLPWLTLLGAVVGLIGMSYLFVRMNRELNESSRQTEVENQIEQAD